MGHQRHLRHINSTKNTTDFDMIVQPQNGLDSKKLNVDSKSFYISSYNLLL